MTQSPRHRTQRSKNIALVAALLLIMLLLYTITLMRLGMFGA